MVKLLEDGLGVPEDPASIRPLCERLGYCPHADGFNQQISFNDPKIRLRLRRSDISQYRERLKRRVSRCRVGCKIGEKPLAEIFDGGPLEVSPSSQSRRRA